jgi:hypothetical protein
MSVVTDSCRVIADGDVRAIGVFKTRGHPLYRAEMLPWRPIFSTRETAMEATLAYFNSKEGGGESEDSQYQAGVLAQ